MSPTPAPRATVQDVLDRWLSGRPPDPAKVEPWLADAETLIRSEYPDLDQRVADGSLPVAQLILVECQMVLRVLNNPTGATSVSDSAGPFAKAVRFEVNDGQLYLTDSERDLLAGATSGIAGLGVISTTRGPIETPSVIERDLWPQ